MPRPIVLVLVGTKAAGNLGSVCRIAKAFDFAAVRLVEPDVAATDDDARRLGRGAHDMLDAVEVFRSLPDALADCWRSGATTARPRHWSRAVHHPGEALGLENSRRDAPYGVVFGPEDSGLRNEDLSACDEILSIPLPEATGATLSLPASCAIVCHELSRSLEERRPAAEGTRAEWSGQTLDAGRLDDLIDRMMESLDEIGFRPVPDRMRFRGTIRDFLGRARPTVGDHRLLRHIFAQVGKWKRRLIGEVERGEFPAKKDGSVGPETH